MKVEEIRDLIDFIAKSGLDNVTIETDEIKLKVSKNEGVVQQPKVVTDTQQFLQAQPETAQQPAKEQKTPDAETKESEEDRYVAIKSPMIGTFYRSPNPDAAPFVQVGDKVTAGQPVCIIEAMKLFNEIESEVSGTIAKVVTDNATPVEYDQTLFLVDPS